MKISKRLNVIADMIESESRVIDVGCDHGLLSIYLSNEKNCSCIACDINENALKNAIINVKKYEAKNVQTFLTDGIENIDINDDDTIVIAGMGTSTIKHILSNKKLCNTLIISSNNQLYELRKYVTNLNYKIVEEKFIDDHKKKYIIIKFVKGRIKYSKNDLKYGPISKNNLEYLIYKLEKLLEIKNKIIKSNFAVKIKNSLEIRKIKKMIKKIEKTI